MLFTWFWFYDKKTRKLCSLFDLISLFNKKAACHITSQFLVSYLASSVPRLDDTIGRWTFFTLICCKNCINVCLKRPKINEKETGVDLFLKRKYLNCHLHLDRRSQSISTYVTLIPPLPPSCLPSGPAVGLNETVWSSAVKAHSTLTVLSVSCMITGFS